MTRRPSGTGCLYRRGSVWWIKYHRNGRSFHESGGSTREEALRLLKRRFGEIVTGQFVGGIERVAVRQLLNLLIEDYERHERRSLKSLQWRVTKHLLPAVGNIRAADFGRTKAQAYIDARRRAGTSNATINRELAALRRAFNLGAAQDPPLVSRVPHIPHLPEDNARQGFLEHEQYLALRDALPQHLKPLLVVGFHLGNRLGELRSLRWDQVDLAAGEIRLAGSQTKNKRPRTLPVYGEMKAWLEMQRSLRDQKWSACPWVFSYMGRQIGSHLKGWSKACAAAGVPGLLFHDLRRSAVRNMERAGIPRNVAMSITGHRTESVYRRYDIVSRRDLQSAAAKMESYMGQQPSVVTNPVTAGEKVQ